MTFAITVLRLAPRREGRCLRAGQNGFQVETGVNFK